MDKKISVITVCYNERDNIRPLYQRVASVLSGLTERWELIYVDNASTDGSDQLYRALAREDRRVTAILMSRNFGSSQPSYLAGLAQASGDCAVLMDGDLQDPPEVIARLVEKWLQGFEVVYGVRQRRRGNLLQRAAYKVFYRLFRKLAYIDIPLDAGDFSLIDRRVITEMVKFGECDLYLRGVRAYVGFRQTGVAYVREARGRGEETTNFSTYLRWAKSLIVNFSFRPLEWISKLAFAVVGLALVALVVYVALSLIYPAVPRGIPTLIVLVLFFGGVQLLCLAIIGEYLARIFQEVKRRPRYIIREILNNKAGGQIPSTNNENSPPAGDLPEGDKHQAPNSKQSPITK